MQLVRGAVSRPSHARLHALQAGEQVQETEMAVSYARRGYEKLRNWVHGAFHSLRDGIRRGAQADHD